MRINIPLQISDINDMSVHQVHEKDRLEYEAIIDYLNVKPWVCSACQLKNFGRNQRCANFRCKHVKPT